MHDDKFTAITEALAEGLADALQALRQSTAVAELLIQKGVVTQAELDAQMRLTEDSTKK